MLITTNIKVECSTFGAFKINSSSPTGNVFITQHDHVILQPNNMALT